MQVHPEQVLRLPSSIVTIGALDGVHYGHQMLIKSAKTRAVFFGVPLVVYTFDPPPKVMFNKVQQLTSLDEKLRRLSMLGVDDVVVASFNERYMTRSAESFLQELNEMNPMEIWTGPDFHFGKNKQGNNQTLMEQFSVQVVNPVRCRNGEIISSSRIRSLLKQHKYNEAKRILGWPLEGNKKLLTSVGTYQNRFLKGEYQW